MHTDDYTHTMRLRSVDGLRQLVSIHLSTVTLIHINSYGDYKEHAKKIENC